MEGDNELEEGIDLMYGCLGVTVSGVAGIESVGCGPPLCGRSEEKLTQQVQSLKQELSSCKSKLIDLKNTKAHNISLQNEITRLNLDNESLKDEVSDLKKVIEKWTSSKVTLDQLLTEQVLGNIVCALRGRGKRMETISSKEIVFSKGENSSSEIVPEVTSDTKSEYDNQEPPPPLLKFTRDEPIGTSNDVTPLADLVQTSKVFDKIKQVTEKESLVNPTKKKTQTMSPSVPDPSPDKKADSSTEKALKIPHLSYLESIVGSMTITLMSVSTTLDVTSVVALLMNPLTMIKRPLPTTGNQGLLISGPINLLKNSGCSRHMAKVEQYLHRYSKELGPKVVFRDNSLGDTEGYDSVKCNGITFTRVAYVNAERRNKTPIEAARTMLNGSKLPKQFWGKVVNTTCYTQNRSIIVKMHGKTACDIFRGRSPDISYFYVFRSHVCIHNHRDHLGKFIEKADDGFFFLRCSLVAKAFRVFNIRRQEMEETYYVTFNEADEVITQTSIEGDEINFNENRSC
ncbi:retrovirus-related pol polyprotein from transposon TNT 1-94 [Tanacetum coccineum]